MTTPAPAVKALADAGVSVWLDDLNRAMVRQGELAAYVERGVVGVTTNPSIFAAALEHGEAYEEALSKAGATGASVADAIFELTTTDVREACDVLRPVYDRTEGKDGRVSIEVDPGLARDTKGTVELARRLWSTIDRPNLLIKIPATVEGLPAITQCIAEGISVNVTLIFSLDRYRAVLGAWMAGADQALEQGRDVATLQSVASFFVSRVDAEVDRRLEAIGTDEALALRGKAAIANARLAYAAYEETMASERGQHLVTSGVRPQRPLWASTSTKNPDYPDTMYVTELVAENTVNTMPAKTLAAVEDHGEVRGDTVRETYAESQQVLDALEALGISYTEVVEQLEEEGVSKFADSWSELTAAVEQGLARH